MKTATSKLKQTYRTYLDRFYIHPLSNEAKLPLTDIYIVIPAFAEENLAVTLKSLFECQPVISKVCIVLVINHSNSALENQKFLNIENARMAEDWAEIKSNLEISVIKAFDLTDKNAGVGLVRKIGMDACIVAAHLYENEPAIVCLDGDCQVSDNYLQCIETQFYETEAEVAVLEFRHLILDGLTEDLAIGISQYELFLEYYRLGLWSAGYPFYFHTVGSSMACKAMAYAKSGGMNQRLAGEDFYFLHKLFPHYKTVELSGKLVFPSPRISNRVPFGTGKFQQNWIDKGQSQLNSYHPETFRLLSIFFKTILILLESECDVDIMFEGFLTSHTNAREFLKTIHFEKNMMLVLKSSQVAAQRKKAFYRWFDGLMVLKFIHFFRPYYQDIPVRNGILILLPEISGATSDFELVNIVRRKLN